MRVFHGVHVASTASRRTKLHTGTQTLDHDYLDDYNHASMAIGVEYGDRLVGVGAGTVVVGLLDEIVNHTSVNATGVDIKPGRITVTNQDLTHLYTYSGALPTSA